MRRVIRAGAVAGLLAAISGLTGCINQGEYDRLYEANNSLRAQIADMTRERDEARLAADQLRGGINRGEGTLADLQRQNAELRAQLNDSMNNFRNLEGKISGLEVGALDPQTTSDLQNVAGRFPSIISFDAERGMLRVSSDLTFDSGSAVVKNEARGALQALSEALRSTSAQQYEIVVEGHTDSQRISNPNTLKEHKTNRHLSVHRSIAVIDTLAGMGVPNNRLMAAGWGEFRPSVQNTASGNTPANRRVEIYLAKPVQQGNASLGAPNAQPAAREIDMTK